MIKNQKKIRVILADDHQLFREGVNSLLVGVAHIEVVGTASSGRELLEKLETTQADIAIVDIAMPDMNGIEATRIISEKFPNTKVLILSMHNTEEFIHNAISSGAVGYLPKDTEKEVLLKALRDIYDGHLYLDPHISEVLLKGMMSRPTTPATPESKVNLLTAREKEIVQLVAEGYINKEIAARLDISVRTVDAHKNNIITKLKLKSSVDIVKFAIKHGLVEL